MASITKCSTGYRVQINIKGERDSTTKRTKREAEAWAFQRESEMREAKGKPEIHTLRDALVRYREEVSPTKSGERWERIRIDAFLREKTLPCDSPLDTLTSDDLGAWRDARLKEVSAGAVLRDVSMLSAVLETARREWKWCASNALNDMRKPRAPDHREVTITMCQAAAMLREMGYHYKGNCKSATQAVCVAFLFALRTGMRAGEVCKLKWCDVMPGHFKVTATERGAGKTGKRDVPATRKMMRLVNSMHGWDGTYVFGISSQVLDALFRRYRNRAGLEGFTFHDTRHTAATMIAQKIDILDLCKMFGWRTTKQALTYYNPKPDQIRRKLEADQSPR